MHSRSLYQTDKEECYRQLLPQMQALMAKETDIVACMANFCALLHTTFRFLWTGFYFVRGNELLLGPFQGNIACTRIAFGKGVCGKAWERRQTLIVGNVERFDGHIACDSRAVSEIVVPISTDGQVVAVLDIDSRYENRFDSTDARHFEALCNLLPPFHSTL
jgi:GAF domain-containing protein